MNPFDDELNRRLAALGAQGLRRELRRVDSPQDPRIVIGGKTFLNFSSNDYLGLANHPALKEAAIKAVEKYGAGAGASRLICGSLAPFHELEDALAAFKDAAAALTFSTGYAAALGTITALVGKNDIVIVDKLVHACIVDAARLSGAKLRVFAHNDLNDLEDILKWAAQSQITNRKFSSSPNPFSRWMATPLRSAKWSRSRKNTARGSWWTRRTQRVFTGKTGAVWRTNWASAAGLKSRWARSARRSARAAATSAGRGH
jgi:hypothetical protein